MDLKKLAGTLLSSDSISSLSDLTGASGSDVTSVLTKALPALLSGANEQATNKKSSESFVSALSQHAKDDTNNLSDFIGNVDLSDGAKIISHLLGSDKDSIVKDISKETGVSQNKTSSILSAIAPLLMSLLGQQADKDTKKKGDSSAEIGELVGTLLSNVDVGDLLTGLLGDDSKSSGKKTTTKKKSTKKSSSTSDTAELIGGIIKGLLK